MCHPNYTELCVGVAPNNTISRTRFMRFFEQFECRWFFFIPLFWFQNSVFYATIDRNFPYYAHLKDENYQDG